MSDVLDMSSGGNRVRAALMSADGLTLQQVGENSALSRLLDLPGGVVAAAPDRARQEMAYQRISEDELFARWAEKSRENAALARDDTDGLLGAFRAVENFGNRLMHWAVFESAGDVKDMGREIGNVSANVGRQLVHGAADFNRSLAGAAQSVSDNLFGPDSAPSRYFKGVQDWIKWARPEEVRADSFLGQLGYDFVRSAPQQLGNIMAFAANPVAALSLMGVQITGGSYANLRDQNVSPGRALVSSLTNAVAQAPLEKLGLDRFISIFRSSSFRDTIGRTLGSMGTELVTEYLQQWPEAVTELWALAEKESDDVAEQVHWFGSRLADAETLARINREGAYAGLIGGMWGLFGGGARSLAVRNIERQRAADFAQQNVALHAAVEGAKTKQLAPDHMADALVGASDVLAQSVYIPAQAALDMAAQGQDILTPLGFSAEQVQQAIRSGADLEVPLATLQSRLDSAGMESVAQIMRQTADAPNALEAAQVDGAAQAVAVVEDARRRQRQLDVVRQEEARLVSEMLPLVGNREAAEQYATLFRAQAAAFETAYGLDAAESLRRVRVERGETAQGGETLDQAAMYRGRENDVTAFVERVLAETPDAKKSYFVLRDVTTSRAGFNRVSVELASDQVRHDTRRHPGNTIWEEIPDVIEQGEVYSGRGEPVTGEKSIIFVRSDGESADVVMGTIVRGDRRKRKGRGLRFVVGTAFKDKAKSVEHWLKGKKDAAPWSSDEEITSYPRQEGVPYGSGRDIPENRLPEDRRPVNAPAPFAASPDTFLSEDDAAPRILFQDETGAEGAGGNLPARFAALEPVEADSSLFFGEGKAIEAAPDALREAVKAWARQSYPDGLAVRNADRGWNVRVTPRGIKASLSHGFDETLARSVPFIPKIIESGIYLDSIQKKPGLMSHIFANRIRLDGQEYVVGFVLREDANGNRFYDHELTQVLSPDRLAPRPKREATTEQWTDQEHDAAETPELLTNQGAVMNILRDRLGVNDGTGRILFQDETDGVSESGRVYPDNGREVGVITGEIAATLALDKPGPIVLDDIGRQHVEERHGKEIRSLGFADAQEFISFVLSHVDAVYAVEGHSRKYDIVSRAMTPQGRVMVRLEFDAAGDYYSVATAGTVRKKFYDKKVPLWESANLNHSSEGTPDAIFSGQSGTLRQDAATEINLTSGAAKGKRASVTFQPGGEAVIRIFKGDLSSIPHEAAHIFVEDLRRVADDDGGIARESLRAELERAGMDAEPFAALLSGESDAEDARAMLRDLREGLAALDDGDAGLRAAQKEAARGEQGAEIREDIRAALKANEARRRVLLAQERVLAAHVRHLDGVRQARADMAVLRRFAGVPESGELTADQWRTMQEYAARGFETYLSEGRAPSRELAGVFARLKRWLLAIYQNMRPYLGRVLNDDVRRVYDRLLAAEMETESDASVRAAFELERDFLDDAALTEPERAELEALRDRAEAEVTAKRDSALARERGKRYREAFDEARKTLQEAPFWTFIREVTRREAAPYEGAPRVGGISRDSLVEYLGEDMTKDIAGKMPRLVNAQGGGSALDVLEVEYNLADGDADALAHLIYDAIVVQDAGVNKLAARHAEQTLAEQDRLAMPEDGLLAGEDYGKYLEAVEKAMNRLGRERQAHNAVEAAKRMERESLPERYYRNMARQEVAGLTVSQLSPQRYVAALRRALSERSQAVRRGRFVDAVRAMQRARMAFALMQETKKARELADRVQKKARKSARVKGGTYPAAQTEAIRKLVSALGFPAPQQAWDAELEKAELKDLVQMSMDETSAIDLMPLFPDWLLDLENPDPAAKARGVALDWRGLTSDDVGQVENLLDFLVHSGREQSRTDKNSLRARVQALADSAAASMADMKTYYAPRRDSLADSLARGFSSIDSLEWQMRKADGFQHVPGRKGSTEGALEREIYAPLRAATDRYHVRLASTQKAMTPHLVHLLESAKAWEKKFGKKTLNIRDEQGNVLPVPEAIRRAGDTGWTSEMVIGMALNMGNEGNRERLRSSYADEDGRGGLTFDMVSLILGDDAAATLYGLEPAALAQITAGRERRDGILSAADWKAIQGVWDVMGSQWTDTQAAHKKIYGFAPQGIEPGAFAVRVGGETVQLPGGYYPIKYDPRLDMKMRAQEGKENILDRSEGIFGVPAARKGFTMGRVQHTGRSLRLGVDALQKHLVDSARFIELAYDVRLADKVITNPAFASEYQRVFGIHDYDRIRPNLKALVVDEAEPSSDLCKAAELARKHLVYYALSFNIHTALTQLMAAFSAVSDVGALNVARGLAQLTTRGSGLVREVWAASPCMERRFRNIDDDLARKALTFQPGRGMSIIRGGRVYTWDDVANVGMMPIALADLVVTTAIWFGAYNKKMKELGSRGGTIDAADQHHAEAVAWADKVIAQSNPDNDALSKSAFGRDRGVARLFNAFSGAATRFAQRTRYALQGVRRGKVSPFEFGRMELYDMFLPAVAMTVMAGLMQGAFGGDDDDDKRLAKPALSYSLGQVAMAIPVFGNPAADMFAAALGAGSGRRGELSSAIDMPLQLVGTAALRLGEATRSGEVDGEKLLMSTLDIAGYAARIPVVPVTRRTMRGREQWEQG